MKKIISKYLLNILSKIFTMNLIKLFYIFFLTFLLVSICFILLKIFCNPGYKLKAHLYAYALKILNFHDLN